MRGLSARSTKSNRPGEGEESHRGGLTESDVSSMAYLPVALAYARMGWAVFPLRPLSKVPATPNGFKDATTDPAVITAWWTENPTANIGIATGASNLFVVDVDTKNGKKGAETLSALVAEYGDLPETYTVKTWSGGWHYFFQMPEPRLKNSTGTEKAGLGPDVDTRGDGGYVVAGPSEVEENGGRGRYGATLKVRPAELPAWVAEKLTPRRAYVAPGRPTTPPAAPRAVQPPNGPQAAPEGLRRYIEGKCAEIVAMPVGSACTQDVNDIAFELAQFEEISEEELRTELRAAVDTWEDGHEKGYAAIEQGLKDAGKSPRVWEERRTTTDVTENSFTDAYMADIVAQGALAGVYCWSPGMNWMRWTGKHWKECDESAVVEAVRLFVIDRTENAVRRMREAAAGSKAELDGWSRFHSALKLRAVTGLAKALVTVDDLSFDADPDLLNCANGVVDLRTGELRAHDPALRMTRICQVDYDPGAECEEFNAVLTAMPDDIREWMKVVIGQAATGHRTDRDLVPILRGGGENGKTTLMQCIAVALGTYYTPVADALLLGNAQRDETMALKGARFALIEETPEGAYLNAAMLKKVTQPQMQGHHLYARTITWDSTHTLFVSTNYKPVVTDTDDGTWRRVALVVFPFKFVRRNPRMPHERRGDPTLRPRVEAGDPVIMRAALRWIVDGSKSWYAANRVLPELPDPVQKDTLEWRMETDLYLSFWSDVLESYEGAHVATVDVWSKFESWAKARGHTNPGTMRTFVPRFAEHPETVANGVVRKDGVRATKGGLSRPDYSPPLPHQFSAFLGVRFRPTEATLTGPEEGPCDPCDPSKESPQITLHVEDFGSKGHKGHVPEISAGQSGPAKTGRPYVPPGGSTPPAA